MDWTTLDFGEIPDQIFLLLSSSTLIVSALLILALVESVRIGKSVYNNISERGLPAPATEKDFRDNFEKEYPDLVSKGK